MAAVVNVLHFKDPVDPSLFADAKDALSPKMEAIAASTRSTSSTAASARSCS